LKTAVYWRVSDRQWRFFYGHQPAVATRAAAEELNFLEQVVAVYDFLQLAANLIMPDAVAIDNHAPFEQAAVSRE